MTVIVLLVQAGVPVKTWIDEGRAVEGVVAMVGIAAGVAMKTVETVMVVVVVTEKIGVWLVVVGKAIGMLEETTVSLVTAAIVRIDLIQTLFRVSKK